VTSLVTVGFSRFGFYRAGRQSQIGYTQTRVIDHYTHATPVSVSNNSSTIEIKLANVLLLT